MREYERHAHGTRDVDSPGIWRRELKTLADDGLAGQPPSPGPPTVPGETHETGDRRSPWVRRLVRLQPWAVLLTVFLGTMARGTRPVDFDALYYWIAAGKVIGTADLPPGFLEVRGALGAPIYVPAALLAEVLGTGGALTAVLVQNSLLVALVAAFLLPRLAGRPRDPWTAWGGAALVLVVLSPFAPYALVDLYPAVALLLALLLLRSRRPASLATVGVLLAFTVGVRPSYLVPVLLLAAVLASHRVRALLPVGGGVALGLLPQSFVNLHLHGTALPWPVDSAGLVRLQAAYASYVVRYDTVPSAPRPQLFHCSPAMAERVPSPPPEGLLELARHLLVNLPDSFVFALQKIAAAFLWGWSTPYTAADEPVVTALGVTVALVSGLGVAYLVRPVFGRHPAGAGGAGGDAATQRTRAWAWAAIAVGSMLTLVSSTPEARFALPVVLVGVVGCTTAIAGRAPLRAPFWGRVPWWVPGLALGAFVVAVGSTGMVNPAPPGDVTPEICAAAPSEAFLGLPDGAGTLDRRP